jgi:putative transposase
MKSRHNASAIWHTYCVALLDPHRQHTWLRDELLNETLFTSLAHAREALANWMADYNQERPHSGIGNLPPALYAKLSAPGTQRAGVLRYTEGLRAPSRWITEPSELN